MSAASLGNGSADRPWKERVQSIFSSGADSSSRGLSESPLFEMLSVVGLLGVGAVNRGGRGAWEEGCEVEVVVDRGVVVVVVLLELFWTRGALELIARAVIWLRSWCEVMLVRDEGVTCWRDSNARQGRQRRADMVG